MRAVFHQSWALLAEDECLMFAKLSVFRGGFTSDAAERVAGASLFQGDYTICQAYAQRSWTIIEDLNMFICQAYNLATLIVLACLREDYAEAVRLKELEQQYTTNTMGFQLLKLEVANRPTRLSVRKN
jgi:hypothetical protein